MKLSLNKIKHYFSFPLLIVLITSIFTIYWINNRHLTGDEPHYLTITYSIIHDKDIALKNNYNNIDYKIYYDGVIANNDRHISPNSTKVDEYSLHNIGLPIILVPGFILDGRTGATLEITLIGIISLLILYTISNKIIKTNNKKNILLVLYFTLSIPLSIYSHIIANEIIIATIIAIYFYIAFFTKPTKLKFWFILIVSAFLPWLHIKYIVVSVLLSILIFIKQKNYLVFLPLVISIIGLSFFMKHYYGSYLLTAQYPEEYPHLLNFMKGIIGIFFDRSFGLIVFNPLMVFIPAAMVVTYKVNKKIALETYLIFFSLVFLNSLYGNKIGWCPAGRMLVAIMPIIFIWYIYLLNSLQTRVWLKIFYILMLLSIFLGLILNLIPPLSYSTGEVNRLFDIIRNLTRINFSIFFPRLLAITDYLPSTNGWVNVKLIDWLRVICWIAFIVVININLLRSNKTKICK